MTKKSGEDGQTFPSTNSIRAVLFSEEMFQMNLTSTQLGGGVVSPPPPMPVYVLPPT